MFIFNKVSQYINKYNKVMFSLYLNTKKKNIKVSETNLFNVQLIHYWKHEKTYREKLFGEIKQRDIGITSRDHICAYLEESKSFDNVVPIKKKRRSKIA